MVVTQYRIRDKKARRSIQQVGHRKVDTSGRVLANNKLYHFDDAVNDHRVTCTQIDESCLLAIDSG
jgi:hypothetical protein